MPPHLDSYFLCNSGSEAVDNAVKIARAVTGRGSIIAFDVGLEGGEEEGEGGVRALGFRLPPHHNTANEQRTANNATPQGGFHGRTIGAMALTSSKVCGC